MAPAKSRHGVVVIGELNVDLVATGLQQAPVWGQEILADDFQMVLGSASAIFACGVARLGLPVTFISKVGTDDFGRFCLAALEDRGIMTWRVAQDPQVKTGVTISLSTRQDRALVTYLGAIAQLTYDELPLIALHRHSHLHLTSYFLQTGLQASFSRILQEAKALKLTTSFDPNSDPDQQWRAEIWEVFTQTDILFLNQTEALQLTQQRTARQALKWLGPFIPCVVIKRGPKGAVAIKDGQIYEAPGYKVATLDTTGAGDSFAAGFVAGYVKGQPIAECLELGNVCGALSTLQAGGTAGQPNRAQVRRFLQAQKSRSAGA